MRTMDKVQKLMVLILNKVVHFSLWSYLPLHNNGLMGRSPFYLSVLFTTLSAVRLYIAGRWMNEYGALAE